MSINTTTRLLNLEQLDEELRVAAGLHELPGVSAAWEETPTGLIETQVRCDHDAINQTLLDNVIDTHVPAPPPPSIESRLQAQIDELTDLLMEVLG